MKKQLLEDLAAEFGGQEIPEGWVEVDFNKDPIVVDLIQQRPDLEKEILEDPEGVQRLLAACSFDRMMKMVERREAACKQVKPCPKCDSIQVQLVNWDTDILKMKCRSCKHKFEKTL